MMKPLTKAVAPTPPGPICFGGGAWACAYSLGAAVHLRRKFRHLPDIPIGGVSSGAIVALAYILARSDEEMVSMFDAMSELARIYGTTGTMSLYIHLTLDRVLPIHGTGGTEYQRLNGGRFSVGITRFPCRPALICEWKSNQHVHDVIHTSVHVPYIAHTNPHSWPWTVDFPELSGIFHAVATRSTYHRCCRKHISIHERVSRGRTSYGHQLLIGDTTFSNKGVATRRNTWRAPPDPDPPEAQYGLWSCGCCAISSR